DAADGSVTVGSSDGVVDVPLFSTSLLPSNVVFHVIDAASGAPVQDATVDIAEHSVTTGAQGLVSIDALPSAAYTYTVTGPSYIPMTSLVTVHADMTVEVALVKERLPPATLTFLAIDTVTGQGLPGASVKLGGREATTDADGFATFSDVARGEYVYGATFDDYLPLTGAVTVLGATLVRLPFSSQDLPGARVTFTVQDASAAPVIGASVRFASQDATTDRNGVALFADIPSGTYIYDVVVQGYASHAAREGVVTVVGRDVDVDVMLEARIAQRMVSFHVVDATSGAPLENVEVRMDERAASTDADGRAIFAAVAAGSHPYSAQAPGYTVVRASAVVVDDSDVTQEVALHADTLPAATVTFVVVDADQRPLEGVSLTFGERVASTGADGTASFADVRAGSHPYDATFAGWLPESGAIDANGMDIAKRVVLSREPPLPVRLTFAVTDGVSTRPLPDALVRIGGEQFVTGPDGTVVLIHALPGTYPYDVEAFGYVAVHGSVVVGAQDVVVDAVMYPFELRAIVGMHVFDGATGQDIPGATLAFAGMTFTTDEEGRAIAQDLAAGTHVYSASAPGFVTSYGETTVSASRSSLDMPLFAQGLPAMQLTFNVIDDTTQAPLANTIITVAGRSAVTGEDGTVVIPSVPAGSYSYDALHAGHSQGDGSITAAGTDATVTIALERLVPPRVTFHVFDGLDPERGLGGAQVRFDRQIGTTDGQGG
ncbi:MAG: carboxypeptidase regulatory-like domain-containing protein, partial [Nanoarchaeota archaeon]